MRKPTTEEILAIDGSVPVEMAGAVPWPVERLYLLCNAETGLADWHSVPARKRVVL